VVGGNATRTPLSLFTSQSAKKCTWKLRKRKFLPDRVKKFVKGRYAVLRRDGLTEGESCVVTLDFNVSVFHNAINNLHKI
jgi:hypothetical protein